MDSNLHDWLHLLLRFVHLVTGIMWIGSSFYFIWLDSAFEVPKKPRHNVDGELFMVHGGFYYQVEKKKIAPGEIPDVLHWFKWEATLTWITGFFLLGVVYYMTGGVYLVDPAISNITPALASIIGIGILIVGWIAYDLLWRSKLSDIPFAASTLSIGLTGVAVYFLCHTLGGRAAFIHIGSLFGTLMVLNVWIHILPAQKKMLSQAQAGMVPDYSIGLKGKTRSVHNTYMTFPVLFIMLSNHFPMVTNHKYRWIVLTLIIIAGALSRHVMVTKKRWLALPAAACIGILMVMTAPKSHPTSAKDELVTFSNIQTVIQTHCLACHSAKPTDTVFKTAPNGVMFDTAEQIKLYASKIVERTSVVKNMPLANKTGMTDEERTLIALWFSQRAPGKN